MRTEHRDQASFCPFALREIFVLAELCYSLIDVPPIKLPAWQCPWITRDYYRLSAEALRHSDTL